MPLLDHKPGSLAEAYESVTAPIEGSSTCKTCRWWFDLSPEDKKFFDDRVSDPMTNRSVLLRACTLQGGLEVSRSSFRNHIASHHPKLRDQS